MQRNLLSQSGLAFFGLTTSNLTQISEAKISIYRQIHQICFHSKGGYSWPIIYNMPIYLRHFIFNEIKEFYDEKNKTSQTSTKNSNQQSFNPSQIPKIPTPTFSTTPSPSPKVVKYK